ncbi:MAG: VWA domain-containing protein, partial [Candidatus Micrarchaeota archaeon]
YGLRYHAPTIINVLFSGTPRPPKPPELNESEDFEQPASVAEVIIDASGSMNGTVSGVRKIDTAKQFVAAFVERISSMKTGFRVYGSQHDETSPQACNDTILLYPINYVDGAAVKREINAIEPKGQTPMAYALSRAAADFQESNESKLVVLVSDGLESCGRDPCAVAAELNRKHARVFAIGFDIDPRGREQLQCLADATDGRYYDAKNYRDLINIVDLIFVKRKLIDLLEVAYVNQSIVEDKDGFRIARLEFTAFNRGDLTRAVPSITGLPNNTQASFDPAAFHIATSATQKFSAIVRVPQDRDYYEAMLNVESTRGKFSIPIAVRAREPLASSLTGLFVAAAPALGLLVLLVIIAAILNTWHKQRKQRQAVQSKVGEPLVVQKPRKTLGQRWDEFMARFRRPRYGYCRPYR